MITEGQGKNIVTLIIALFSAFFLYKLFQEFGLIATKGSKTAEDLGKQPYFLNPTKYISDMAEQHGGANVNLIHQSEASELASKIYWSKGYIYDNEGQADSVLTNAPSLVIVAQIAERFAKDYGRTLYSYLLSFLEDSDWIVLKNNFEGKDRY